MKTSLLNLDSFLPYKLSFVTNLVSEVIADSYQNLFGLRVPEWRLLAVLAETDGATQLEIGLRTRMDKVTVSRAALAMQARGLIDRRPNPDDGRSHLLVLGTAGAGLYRQVVPLALQLERAVFDGLSASELRSLDNVLDKVMLSALACLDSRQQASP